MHDSISFLLASGLLVTSSSAQRVVSVAPPAHRVTSRRSLRVQLPTFQCTMQSARGAPLHYSFSPACGHRIPSEKQSHKRHSIAKQITPSRPLSCSRCCGSFRGIPFPHIHQTHDIPTIGIYDQFKQSNSD